MIHARRVDDRIGAGIGLARIALQVQQKRAARTALGADILVLEGVLSGDFDHLGSRTNGSGELIELRQRFQVLLYEFPASRAFVGVAQRETRIAKGLLRPGAPVEPPRGEEFNMAPITYVGPDAVALENLDIPAALRRVEPAF